jgi:glycosyltransferase involved in cell wall biosynthesis
VSPRAPRVLVLGTLLGQPMGGVRRHNAELLPRASKLLRERGGSLAVLEGREPAAFDLSPPIERLHGEIAAHPLLARWRTEGIAVRRVLTRAREAGAPFDLVHTAHLPAPSPLERPFTITIHDLRHLQPGFARHEKRLAAGIVVASAVRRAARVITVSDAVRKDIIERFRIDAARVRVVPNAADHFVPLPRKPARDAPILYVGHVEKRKNLEVVVRALAADRSLPPLLVAGAPKDREDERLRELARRLRVAERVRFRGAFAESELALLYAHAACVVLPSTIEGFGIPALEAQRARAPLALARIPALVEVAGEAARTFAPDDPTSCAEALRSAIATPESTLDRAERSAARFTWEKSAEALVSAWTAGAPST